MSWKNVELGDLCDVLDSQRKPITKRDRTAGEYPYYGATGIVDYVGNYIFDEKLVLIGEDGAKWESGESTAFIANGKYWVNNHAHVIRPKRDLLLDEWLVYYFYYKDLKEFVTGLTVPKLNQGQLKIIPIPLPPLATQQKIVAKLDGIFAEIDKATAAAEANAKNAEALFQSYLDKVFERGGEDWNTYTFDEIVEDKQIGLVKNSKEQLEDGEFAYFKMNNILNNNKCDLRIMARVNATKEELTKFRLVNNDFLFNTRNSTELVGKVCVFEGEERDNILYNNNIMRVRFKSFVSSKFIHQAFSYKKIKAELEKLKTGTTNVAAIYYKDLKNLKLSIPSITQQNSILISLEKLDAITEGIKKQRQKKVNELYKLKQSILRQAFEGQLVKE